MDAPSASAPFKVSNSGLRTVARCSTEAYLKYAMCLTVPDKLAAPTIGNILHLVFARHFQGAMVEDCMRLFDTQWKAQNIGQMVLEPRLKYENVALILRSYLENRPIEELSFNIFTDALEMRFRVPLDEQGEFEFEVVIDALVQDKGTGLFQIMDHKTTGKLTEWWLKKYRLSSQITGYLYAARKAWPNLDFGGAYINALELSRLPGWDRDKKCARHGVQYSECRKHHANFEIFSISRDMVNGFEEWKASALFLAKRLRDIAQNYASPDAAPYLRQQGLFNESCTFCDFADFCTALRPRSWFDDGHFVPKPQVVE